MNDKQINFLNELKNKKTENVEVKLINEIFDINSDVKFVESNNYLIRIKDNIYYKKINPNKYSIEEIWEFIVYGFEM